MHVVHNELINGKEYFPYYFRAVRKPVLFEKLGYSASVTINGRKYDNVLLFYDTYTDELVYTDTSRLFSSNGWQIVLNKYIIDQFSFTLKGKTLNFKYLSGNNNGLFSLPEGFYETDPQGASACLIKHRSVVYEKNGIDEYYYRPLIFIKSGDQYLNIRTERQFIKLFRDRKEEIKERIRKQKIDFRSVDKSPVALLVKQFESSLVK
jgi:hypothetical protein